MCSLKILLVDDHALFREGMRYVLQRLEDGTAEVVEASNWEEAIEIADSHPELDLALLDLNMPDSQGVRSVRIFHGLFPHIPVVVVSGDDDVAQIDEIMSSGAMGFICKSDTASVMLSALNLVLAGGVYVPPTLMSRRRELQIIRAIQLSAGKTGGLLTPRQLEVLLLLQQGLTNKQIADEMSLTEGTVKVHVAAIFSALKVNSRMTAVHAAIRLGLIDG